MKVKEKTPKLNHAYYFNEKGEVIHVAKITRKKGKGLSPRQRRELRKAS